MSLTLRPGRPEDAAICGTIGYEAFKTIAEQYNFPTNYPSPEAAIERMVTRLMHPGFYAVVAELDGRVVGSNFLDERSAIAGLGPITVAPAVQNHTIGRHLMQDVLDRAAARHYPGVRLVLASYHARALSLYAKLGFTVRDVIARVSRHRWPCNSPAIRCGPLPWPISMPAMRSAGTSTAMTGAGNCRMR